MRIAFFGTPEFAVACLKKLVEADKSIVAVITAPDKPSGRGLQLIESDVKKYALSVNLPIFQPEKLKSEEFVNEFKKLEIDIAIVVAFRMMPEIIWSAPKYGTFNLHGSLLPQYRGAAPINWAIMNGETETGVSTFFLNNEIDKGALIFQEKIKIEPTDTFGTLYDKMKHLGADLILKTLDAIQSNQVESIPQHYSPQDLPAPKITKEHLHLTQYESCVDLANYIRGLIPVYKPYFIYKDKKYIVKSGYYELSKQSMTIGTIDTDNKSYLKLICKDGFYIISEIQAEGKKPMDIKSFFNGNQL